MNSLAELVRAGEEVLFRSHIENADLDAMLLWEYAFGKNRAYYWTHMEDEVSEEERNRYMELIRRRMGHEPLQYITGEQEFMGFPFYVNQDVLIPRQDTEVLVEEIEKDRRGRKPASVLDLCTGSGCIILSLKKRGIAEQAAACDISEKALAVAKRNGENLGVEVVWIQSDLYQNIAGTFDVIVSNPPYIETEEISGLMPEVRDFEPILALDGKKDGLFFYRKIIAKAGAHLNGGGRIYLEIGCEQGEAVARLLLTAGFEEVVTVRDLAGLDRVVKGTWNNGRS